MDKDLDKLIPEDTFLSIGKRKFKIWVSSERSLKATDMFNKLNVKGSEERKSIKTDFDMYSKWIDICLLLVQQDFIVMMKRSFTLKTVLDWIRRERLTKKHLMSVMDIQELTDFVDDALEPIIGTKKKELKRQRKTEDAMMLLLDELTPEALAQLLQNSLRSVDTKKAM